MKLTGALIVKNEQELLSRCLDSIQGVDELIIVDTGSSDNTVEIAKKYTDKVYTDFKWCDHYGKARQHAKDKCTGDWIMNIDADEVLANDFSEVRKAVEGAEKIGAQFVNCSTTARTGTDTNRFPRIYKNIPEIQWRGAAHNYMTLTKGERKTYESNIVHIYERSPAHDLDPDRTLRILTNAIKEDPSLSRERYYLAREYYYRKKWKDCIKHLDIYLKNSVYRAEKADGYLMKARCHWNSHEGNEAREACLQAIGINPNFREALEFMSEMYYEPGKSRWLSFSKLADDSGVLFVRKKPVDLVVGKDIQIQGSTPMSLHQKHIDKIKDILKGYKEVKVLEWGAGYSTKYFPDFLRSNDIKYHWTAIEHDKDWYERVKGFNTPNVDLVLADKDSKGYLSPKGKFDFIYIDGRNRVKCLQRAKKLIKPNGVVCLHDADRTKYHVGFKGYKYEILPETPSLWVGSLMV
jgi:glycosyltransferase involved in cell wall biosynthesis